MILLFSKHKTSKVVFLLTALLLLLSPVLQAQPTAAGNPTVLIEAQQGHWMNALWAPDGQTLAFSSDNFNGIWLVSMDGENLSQLTNDPGAGFGYSWSPDGRQILARPSVVENHRRLQQVKLYDVQSLSAETLLDATRQLQGLPAFTPDGSQVAMVVDRKLELRTSDKLTKSASNASAVVYAIDGRLINASLITRADAEITTFEGRFIFNVRMSPNQQKVVFEVQGKGLHVLNTDGSGLRHIGFGEHAGWMPDNRHVVVSVVEDDGKQVTGAELFAVDVVTGTYYPLSSHTNLSALRPAVSPCGKWVAFDNPDTGNIYLMPLR